MVATSGAGAVVIKEALSWFLLFSLSELELEYFRHDSRILRQILHSLVCVCQVCSFFRGAKTSRLKFHNVLLSVNPLMGLTLVRWPNACRCRPLLFLFLYGRLHLYSKPFFYSKRFLYTGLFLYRTLLLHCRGVCL